MIVESKNTVYGIYYATNSKILRRIVVPHLDEHLTDGTHVCGEGESVIFRPAGFSDELPDWENHVHTATGVVPPDSKCAVVDQNNNVVNFLNADPELDQVDGHHLVLCNGRRVLIGDICDLTNNDFISPGENFLAINPNYQIV